MTRTAPLLLALLAVALAAPSDAASPPRVSLDTLETRAKAAGWKLLSRDGAEGGEWATLELDDGKHYAYVSTLDLAASRESGEDVQFEQTKNVGLQVIVEEPGSAGQTAKALVAALTAKVPLESLTRDTLKSTLKVLGWRIERADLEQQDGVAQTMIDAGNAAGALVRVDLVDVSAAAKEERVQVRGTQYVVVGVCKDCQARKTGFFAGIAETQKAQKLLRRLVK